MTSAPWARRVAGEIVSDRLARRVVGYERDGLGPLLLRLQQDALGMVGVTADDRFLDVGCATGAAVRAAAQVARIAVGVDRSPAMIEHARQRARAHPRVRLLCAAAERLPFGAGAFTAVLCTSVVHYCTDPQDIVDELARVLDARGRLVVGDFVHGSTQLWRPTSDWWPQRGLTVARRWRTLTPFGLYLILAMQPAPGRQQG